VGRIADDVPRARRVTGDRDFSVSGRDDFMGRDSGRKPRRGGDLHRGGAYRSESGPKGYRREPVQDYEAPEIPEELAAELYAAEGEPFWVLLAHRNNRFQEQYSLLGADLTISGHGHGGIIRLPFTDGLLSTDRTFFPTHTDGFYEDNGATVFVSRGLGNSGISRRLFNRPELAVLTLCYEVPSSCVADG
jgi:predicted MPP superfamily phosphohydrolase